MEIGRLEKTATLFNTCFNIGAHCVYYPSRYEDDTIIHRNGKRSYTKTAEKDKEIERLTETTIDVWIKVPKEDSDG